jgi:hypothetical protein
MKRYPDADPDRIGMWGHSMGGYITLRSMVVSQDIKVGVIWAGVVARYPDLFTRWNAGARSTSPSPGSWFIRCNSHMAQWKKIPNFGIPSQRTPMSAISTDLFNCTMAQLITMYPGSSRNAL